jgi:collagenase-like PrtC family protease
MRSYCIPYNGDTSLLRRLFKVLPEHSEQCSQIFMPIPQNLAGTCRVVPQTETYNDEVVKVILDAHSRGVKANLLINPGCLGLRMSSGEQINEIVEYTASLMDLVQVDSVTVADYLLAKFIKKACPSLSIECSCLAGIDNLSKAKYWQDIGCDMIVIHPDRNKDIEFIHMLKSNLGNIKMKLILNEICIPNCPMRQGHSNLEGHGDWGGLYSQECSSMFQQYPWLLYTSSFVPPSQLSRYDGLIDVFKILDRASTTEEIIEAFGAYTGSDEFSSIRREWDGRIPDDVYEKVLHCDRQCDKWLNPNFPTEIFYD